MLDTDDFVPIAVESHGPIIRNPVHILSKQLASLLSFICIFMNHRQK